MIEAVGSSDFNFLQDPQREGVCIVSAYVESLVTRIGRTFECRSVGRSSRQQRRRPVVLRALRKRNCVTIVTLSYLQVCIVWVA
jgi:hypothetical protein